MERKAKLKYYLYFHEIVIKDGETDVQFKISNKKEYEACRDTTQSWVTNSRTLLVGVFTHEGDAYDFKQMITQQGFGSPKYLPDWDEPKRKEL